MTSQTATLSWPKANSQITKPAFLEALKTDEKLRYLELARCALNVKYWLWGDGIRHDGYVYTLDTKDAPNPIKRFPKKAYLEELVDLWLANPLLLIPKSRQIMATWLFCALYLWDSQFHKGRHTYFQSKKEDDSDALVRERAGFILQHEPQFLWPRDFDPKRDINYCSIQFRSIHSQIAGIPEGGDQIRSKSPSGVLSDECCFQPEFASAWEAIRPCVDKGARFTGISSAEPSYFQELIEDR